jgi:hypothetical protein
VQAQPLSLDEKCKKLEETIQRVATNTIGYTRKQANKEWFDEECAKVNEEKNAPWERAIQIKIRGAKNAYILARTKQRRLFRKKARQLDEDACTEIERHRIIQDSRKFHKHLNDIRRPFEQQVTMCRAKIEELLSNKNQVLARWKEHFEEHLNEVFNLEQPTHPVNLRDDGVDIDLPSREEIEEALKYLKNNKDSIAAELLKNGGPYLVDTLHKVIQQGWTRETLKGALCPMYKEGDKLDCKNYRGICLLNVTYKVIQHTTP